VRAQFPVFWVAVEVFWADWHDFVILLLVA
jgi:hypothetical protein